MPTHGTRSVALLAALFASPLLAYGQCCPGSGTGSELAAVGMGESNPSASDLSADAGWRIHAFERDGITYYQINDAVGSVHAILGTLDGVFWTLPIGSSPHLVSVPGRRLPSPAGAQGSVVYRGSAFSLVLYEQGGDRIWSVEDVAQELN